MPPIRILIINPNTNQEMTDSLREPVESLGYNNTTYTYLTSPPSTPTSKGVHSINSLPDALLSTTHTLPLLTRSLLASHDAFLVACFSPHPLVGAIRERLRRGGGGGEGEGKKEKMGQEKEKYVLGILEASVWCAGALLGGAGAGAGEGDGDGGNGGGKNKKMKKKKKFGIVTTGDGWKSPLETAVRDILGLDPEDTDSCFRGVECCGVDAAGLHGAGAGDVEGRVKSAVKRLVAVSEGEEEGDGDGEGEVGVVVLGCAGMVGMEGWVRDSVAEGEGVRVVDGVKAGVGILQGLVRGGF